MWLINLYKKTYRPYSVKGQTYHPGSSWVFDDAFRKLSAEPFVSGASEMIQKYLDRKGDTRTSGVEVLFSLVPLKQPDIVLTCTEKCYPMTRVQLEEKFGHNTDVHVANMKKNVKYVEDKTKAPTSAYYKDQEDDQCWLCPAQLTFFGEVADKIYAKFV